MRASVYKVQNYQAKEQKNTIAY